MEAQLQSHSSKLRTVVFKLRRGTRGRTSDFIPHIQALLDSNDIQAFGSPGNRRHIWEVTTRSQEGAHSLIRAGNFTIQGVEGPQTVQVRPYAQFKYTCRIRWIAFWIPHDDVLKTLLQFKPGGVFRVQCERNKLLPSAWSTDRHVDSTICMKDLPHFIDVVSDGHRHTLIPTTVPGRPNFCFDCSSTLGHLVRDCPNFKSKDKTVTE